MSPSTTIFAICGTAVTLFHLGIEDTKMSTDSQEECFSANSGSQGQGGLIAE